VEQAAAAAASLEEQAAALARLVGTFKVDDTQAGAGPVRAPAERPSPAAWRPLLASA